MKRKLLLGLISLSFLMPLCSCSSQKYIQIDADTYLTLKQKMTTLKNYTLLKTFSAMEESQETVEAGMNSSYVQYTYQKIIDTSEEYYADNYIYEHSKNNTTTLVYGQGYTKTVSNSSNKNYYNRSTGILASFHYEKECYEVETYMPTNLGYGYAYRILKSSLDEYTLDSDTNFYYWLETPDDDQNRLIRFATYGDCINVIEEYYASHSITSYQEIMEKYTAYNKYEITNIDSTSIEIPNQVRELTETK